MTRLAPAFRFHRTTLIAILSLLATTGACADEPVSDLSDDNADLGIGEYPLGDQTVQLCAEPESSSPYALIEFTDRVFATLVSQEVCEDGNCTRLLIDASWELSGEWLNINIYPRSTTIVDADNNILGQADNPAPFVLQEGFLGNEFDRVYAWAWCHGTATVDRPGGDYATFPEYSCGVPGVGWCTPSDINARFGDSCSCGPGLDGQVY